MMAKRLIAPSSHQSRRRIVEMTPSTIQRWAWRNQEDLLLLLRQSQFIQPFSTHPPLSPHSSLPKDVDNNGKDAFIPYRLSSPLSSSSMHGGVSVMFRQELRSQPLSSSLSSSSSSLRLFHSTTFLLDNDAGGDEKEMSPAEKKKALKKAAKEKLAKEAEGGEQEEKKEMSPAEKKKALKQAAKEKLAKEAAENEAAAAAGGATTEATAVAAAADDVDGEETYERFEPTPPDWDKFEDYENPLHRDDPNLKKMFAEDFEEGEEMPIQPLPAFDEKYPPHIEELCDELLHLNMLEFNELINKLQLYFGFDDAMLAGGGVVSASSGGDGDGGGGGGEAAAEEQKTKFDLKLVEFDAKAKIKVIKEVRSMAGLGLKEAKEVVEGAPKIVMKDLSKEEAEELKGKLEEVGATVEVV